MTQETMKKLVSYIKRKDLGKIRGILEKESSIDINARDVFGKTLAHYCVVYGSVEIAKYLHEKGLDFSVKASLSRFTPIQLAVLENKPEMVEFLADIGIDLNERTRTGFTPLHLAVIQRNINILNVLLKKRAEVEVRDINDNTPLHVACWLGDLKIVSILVDARANVNAEDPDGRTPLHISAIREDYDLFKLIALKGGDFSKRDKRGLTPLEYILSRPGGHEKILKVLREISSQIKLPPSVLANFMTMGPFMFSMGRFLSPLSHLNEREKEEFREAYRVAVDKLWKFFGRTGDRNLSC